MQILRAVVLASVLLAAASGEVPCPTGPLSEDQLTTLVKGKVAEGRVRQFITSCGLNFVADDAAVRRLKAAGATAAELEALRAAKQPLPYRLPVTYDWGGTLLALRAARQPLPAGPLVVNGVSMEFVPIPKGEFMMGSESREAIPDEKPVHRVRITKAFEMGRYQVTQAQWEAVMGSTPSYFKGADRPVEQVSWNDAQEFLSKLNARNDGYRYRLPTEAEWEYAARAGTTGDNAADLDSVAWYSINSYSQTHSVGQKQASAWGLYDMQGNVWEWCQDWYDDSYYRNSPAKDPQGPSSGSLRVLRGGSWVGSAWSVRVAVRVRSYPVYRSDSGGFRCVRERLP